MSAFTRPAWLEPRTAYIHIPFCSHRCGYCDFAIAVGQDDLADRYLDALEAEVSTLATPRHIQTFYIGGGTPTHLTASQLSRLAALVRQWFILPQDQTWEWTVEANPDRLDEEKLKLLQSAGVTRISLGVQSFQPHVLAALERQHQPDDIPRAVDAIRGRGLDLSIDLIFGAPGSSLSDWDADLERAIALEPQHISTYGLTYEIGTPLWKQRKGGLVMAVDEEAERSLYEAAIGTLEAGGYEQYEVSNFAQPGHNSRHNERYWANEAYYGFGVGAARYIDGCRQMNVRNTADYIRRVLGGESYLFQSETLDGLERAFETMATQLRRRSGINFTRFQEQTGFDLYHLALRRIEPLLKQGLLETDLLSIRLTRRGLFVADGVIEDLMKARFIITPSSVPRLRHSED